MKLNVSLDHSAITLLVAAKIVIPGETGPAGIKASLVIQTPGAPPPTYQHGAEAAPR